MVFLRFVNHQILENYIWYLKHFRSEDKSILYVMVAFSRPVYIAAFANLHPNPNPT